MTYGYRYEDLPAGCRRCGAPVPNGWQGECMACRDDRGSTKPPPPPLAREDPTLPSDPCNGSPSSGAS